MTFEPELVREILRICVASPGHPPPTPVIDGYSADQVGHHIWLMGCSGLVKASDSDGDSSTTTTAILVAMKPAGHELWKRIEDDAFWRRTLKSGKALSIKALEAWLLSQL